MTSHPSQATYCQKWNALTGGPIRVMSEQQARRFDAAGKPYCVLLGDVHQPAAIVEVNWSNDYVGVWFLDDKIRRYLKYTFTKFNTTMFMDEVTLWEYPENTDPRLGDLSTASVVTFYRYQTNGIVRETRQDSIKNIEEVVDRSDVALDINWEPVPTFGDWTSITKLNREPQGKN